MVVEREGKRARENGEQGGRPKRQKVAPRRFVEEFREEIEQVFAQADNEDVEGEEVEDLHTDEGDEGEHDFLDFLEDQAELITLYAAENELDHETAARQLFLEQEDGDGYESSFIDDESEADESNEFVDSESEESESAEETEETESSDTWKENIENGSTSDPDPELELELEE